MGRLLETEIRMAIARGWGRRNGESLFNEQFLSKKMKKW